MTNATVEAEQEESDADHLEDVEDGCGCTEIWEHLSERRKQREGESDER